MSKLPTDLSSVTIVAIDLAKHVFHVHATDASGKVLAAGALRRNYGGSLLNAPNQKISVLQFLIHAMLRLGHCPA